MKKPLIAISALCLIAWAVIAQTTLLNYLFLTSVSFASLGSPGNGAIVYCTDCTSANPVAGSGTGTVARRENGAWNGGGGGAGSTLTAGYYTPFGYGYDTGNQAQLSAGSHVLACWDHTWDIDQTPVNAQFRQWGTFAGDHVAWAIYGSSGTLLFQSATYTGTAVNNALGSVAWTTPSALAHNTSYAICYTSDGGASGVLSRAEINIGGLLTGTTPKYVYTATNASTGTSTLVFPASIGVKVTSGGTTLNFPLVILSQ